MKPGLPKQPPSHRDIQRGTLPAPQSVMKAGLYFLGRGGKKTMKGHDDRGMSPQIPQSDPMFTQSCNDSFIISLLLPGKLGDLFSNKKMRNRKPKYWDSMTPASLCHSNWDFMHANKPFCRYFYLQKLENPPNQILKASCFERETYLSFQRVPR